MIAEVKDADDEEADALIAAAMAKAFESGGATQARMKLHAMVDNDAALWRALTRDNICLAIEDAIHNYLKRS